MAERLSPEDRRERILATAVDVMATEGYRGLSLRELARRCQMSAPGVLHYFDDLDALLIEVLKFRDAMDSAALQETTDRASNLRELLDGIVDYNAAHPDRARVFAMVQGESLSPNHPARHYFRSRTDQIVADGVRLVSGISDDPERLIRQVLAILDGLQVAWLQNPEAFDLRREWAAIADRAFPELAG